MKKMCSVLLCVLLLSLAPTTFAADGDGIGAIGQLFDQFISSGGSPRIKASPKSARLHSRASRLRRNRRGCIPAQHGFAEIDEHNSSEIR